MTPSPPGAPGPAHHPAHHPDGPTDTVLRPRSLADLVTVVPVMLGFHPEHSLVAVCVHGPRHRLGMTVRVDLPPEEHADELADQVAGHVARQEPDGVLLLAFADTDAAAAPLLLSLRSRLADADVDVLEAARADGVRVVSYTCVDDTCCPGDGTPYDRVGGALMAEAVLAGHEVLPGRDALVERFAPVEGERALGVASETEHVRDEVRRLGAGLRHPAGDPVVVRTGWQACLDAVTRATGLDGPVLDDHDVAVLSVWTATVVVRDLLWTDITRESAREQLALWREVGRRAVEPARPPALSLAGFAAWMCGDGAQAMTALEAALAVDPGYSMALLLHSAVSGGIDPRRWPAMTQEEVVRTVPGLG
ncbi:DUF4192 domain-containing protein [Solicola sp. PLA-1-18]|uniref:DUF4192 domain-containing protein n=1 Tax=Solicola sp. PLA-1-18 TaxID=3380532 RepID=UPI003B77C4FD